MKLSEPQLRALRTLAEDERRVGGWVRFPRARTNTLDSLSRLGLVQTRWDYPGWRTEARLTDVGWELLAG